MDKVSKIKEKRYLIFIASIAGLITLLHLLVFANYSPLIVFEELYYIPLLLGALWYGLKGTLLTYVLVSLLYLPFFFGGWTTSALGVADRVLHLVFSGIFTLTAGFFVDHERKRRQQAEREKYLAGIGQISTTIVHDLKNPLITILGYARRIREKKGDPVEAAKTIFESAENMQKIVHDVLDFSKPVQLELKEEDMRSIIKQASEACKAKAEEKGVTLLVDAPDIPITLAIDSFNLQRALVNVINNAIEASDKGQDVEIAVAAKKQSIAIRTSDHGSGMESEAIENIFMPFYTRKSGGTGLGMPIAKKIIESHRGRIEVNSQPGKGTVVTVELPYNPAVDGKRQR